MSLLTWLFGEILMGWFDYFDIDGRANAGCVAVRTFHLFGMPLVPLEALIVFEPSPACFACMGQARCLSFKSRCNWYLWRGWGWSWLRFFGFGIFACCYPRASGDPVAEALASATAAAAGESGASAGYATMPAGDNRAVASATTTFTPGEQRAAPASGYAQV
jgi:hypothetical protein